MITYIYGSDIYGASKAIVEFAEEKKATLTYIDQAEAEQLSIREALTGGTTLFGATIHVLRDPSLWKASLQAEIVDLLKENAPLKAILWDRIKTDKRTALFAALKPFAREFSQLSSLQLTEWLGKEVGKMGSALDPRAAQVLVMRVGSDRYRLYGELEKLSVRYEKITEKEVVAAIPALAEVGNPFHLLDAVTTGQGKQAMAVLDQLLEAGESELGVMGLLAWQVRTLLTISLDQQAGLSLSDIAKKRKMKPFVVEKGAATARRFSTVFLLDALSRIMATDFAAKQGRVESFRTALVMLILGLLDQQKAFR